ncbi:MAG: GntR family transcriptional regulator [Paracoccus sp. (in: a-proteobacteria)]|nr:GntR family transcriptional regulator [Paracoccus sp. (in: a-proteobacteria)]
MKPEHSFPRRSPRIRPADHHRMNTWQSVQAVVLNRIRSGEWPPGQIIPTEACLAQELGCARATVNRALGALAQDGIVDRRRRVGTRVIAQPEHEALETQLARQEIEATGAVYHYNLIDSRLTVPPATVANALHLDEDNSEMLRVHTLQSANSDAYCCTTTYINPSQTPGLTSEILGQRDAFEWVRENLPPLQMRMTLFASEVDAESAMTLGVRPGLSALMMEQAAWLQGHAVALSRRVYRPDHRLSFAL